MHAHHAQRQRMRGRECAKAKQRGGNRDAVAFGERDDLTLGLRVDDAVSRKDDGLARLLNKFERAVHVPDSACSMGCGR